VRQFAIALILHATNDEQRSCRVLYTTIVFDVGVAQNWAQFYGVNPSVETVEVGTLAVFDPTPFLRHFLG
jgi:hypothetical protein